jgi:feruloyl esterase
MFRWLALGAVSLLLIADAIGESGTIAPAQCTGLAKLALPDTKIVREEVVAPGSFLPPNTAQGPDYKSLPAFCRVIAEATPTPDSDIKMEIWLPVSGWNGKFRGQGNGGFAGEIDYSMLGASLSQGYATAGTDTGHAASGTDASSTRTTASLPITPTLLPAPTADARR